MHHGNIETPKKRILITYGWCRTTYAAAVSLSKAGYEIYTCDSSKLAMTRFSRFVKKFTLVADPFRKPAEFINNVIDIIKTYRIDILIPGHEDGLVIQAESNRIPSFCNIIAPPYEKFKKAIDKYQVIKIAEKSNVSVPKTIQCFSMEEYLNASKMIGFPLILKMRRGNSGKGVFVIHEESELINKCNEVITTFDLSMEQWPVLQEFIKEKQLVGACFIAKNGKLIKCFMERYLKCKDSGFGTSVLRERIKENHILEDFTEKMVRALEWTGIGHFDFIGNHNLTDIKLIEMNPRFWGALNLSIVNGFDFPKALVSMVLNGYPDVTSFNETSTSYASRWIVGEIIAFISELKKKKYGAGSNIQRTEKKKYLIKYDDFTIQDPLPFFIELLYYGMGFLKNHGEINPTITEMMSMAK